MSIPIDINQPEWERLGFSVRVENSGRHVILDSPGVHLSLWPTSVDAFDRPKWMAFLKVFNAQPADVLAAVERGRLKMPSEAGEGACKSCGERIWWVKSAKGKNVPLSANGCAHFVTCPQADQHRRASA